MPLFVFHVTFITSICQEFSQRSKRLLITLSLTQSFHKKLSSSLTHLSRNGTNGLFSPWRAVSPIRVPWTIYMAPEVTLSPPQATISAALTLKKQHTFFAELLVLVSFWRCRTETNRFFIAVPQSHKLIKHN